MFKLGHDVVVYVFLFLVCSCFMIFPKYFGFGGVVGRTHAERAFPL